TISLVLRNGSLALVPNASLQVCPNERTLIPPQTALGNTPYRCDPVRRSDPSRRIDAPCTQHNTCALRGEKPRGRLAKSTARARDDDDFSFDVIAHSVRPLIFGSPVVAFRL